ncbi:MAG: sporulation protein YunB [Ruminococcus sp.]|nr:sporulation protein YunB [Ruminococcus sp.]
MFKSKGKTYNKIFSKIITFTIILIISLTFFLLYNFNKEINNNLLMISDASIRKITYNLITDRINHDILNEKTLQDILIINKNNKDEILYVSFNLDKAYKLLDNVSDILTSSFKSLENGSIDMAYLDEYLTHKTNGIVLNIPMGSTLKSNYFYNLGPKVPVKINFIGAVLTNLETKVTNYGLNNALVEIFIYIKINNEIITPFKTDEINLEYDTVIASLMINGTVPSFYNGVIDSSSPSVSRKLD